MASASLAVPPWMDADFFESVLKKSENNRTVKVLSCEISAGSKAGAHFASVIFRARVEYASVNVDHRQVSLIIKTVPFEGDKSEAPLLVDGRIFVRESQVYSNVMVDMQRLLKQSGDDVELGPRLIYSSNAPAWFLVFEDLVERGYQPKTSLLNFEEMKMVMTKIGKWHATSYYLGKMDAQTPVTEYESLLFDEEITDLDALFGDAFRYLRKAVEKWPGDNGLILEKLDSATKNWFARGQAAYKEVSDFCVMNHGDFHFKNIMFKYQNGVLDDLLFVSMTKINVKGGSKSKFAKLIGPVV
jgi:Ecdysteroid kinase-like family